MPAGGRGLGRAIALHLTAAGARWQSSRTSPIAGPFMTVSILVNNAGLAGPYSPVGHLDPDERWPSHEIHVRGTLRFLSAVLPGMRARRAARSSISQSPRIALFMTDSSRRRCRHRPFKVLSTLDGTRRGGGLPRIRPDRRARRRARSDGEDVPAQPHPGGESVLRDAQARRLAHRRQHLPGQRAGHGRTAGGGS